MLLFWDCPVKAQAVFPFPAPTLHVAGIKFYFKQCRVFVARLNHRYVILRKSDYCMKQSVKIPIQIFQFEMC
jgi:hypothetical protein